MNQIPLTCLFIGSILVSNYSLKFNNQINVYQALKLISILFLFNTHNTHIVLFLAALHTTNRKNPSVEIIYI